MTDALVMAGGQSRRMRNTLGEAHKSLVAVGGICLLERNVSQLLKCGFRNVYLAINDSEQALRAYIDGTLQALVANRSAKLTCLIERTPLGTIGVARQVPGDGPLLVVNVDNLTDLDLAAMVQQHMTCTADLTIACHDQPFQIPFGQLVVGDDGTVSDYLEKPRLPIPISSGTYVLSAAAKSVIPHPGRTDITDLFDMLKLVNARLLLFGIARLGSTSMTARPLKTPSPSSNLIHTPLVVRFVAKRVGSIRRR